MPALRVCLFFSCRINSDDSSAPQHLKRRWWILGAPATAATKLIKPVPFNWSNITQWWGGGDDEGLFYVSDSSVFHELSGRVFPPVRTFVCLLCVSIPSSVSDHSLHVIPPLSAGKKKPQWFFSFFQTAIQLSYCCILSLKRMIIRSVQLWWDYSSSSTVASAGDTCFKAPDFILFFFFFNLPAVFFPPFLRPQSHDRA